MGQRKTFAHGAPNPNPERRALNSLVVHVVSHTHWDREWYHTAERFRQRLVPLIDELLDEPGSASFLLDGQTVVLEDYLDVRPERASELAAALKSGRLEAGPWFVLPDELIPTGEGLVRNLLAGARTMQSLRAESPPVLYCPDSFGHPAALPVLARGFNKPVAVVWRGLRAESDTVAMSRGDARILVYHLARSGYELGANLPVDDDAARERWTAIAEQLVARAGTGRALLLNGADHHARQRQLGAAVDALTRAAAPSRVTHSTLRSFAEALSASAGARSDLHGELRDSYGYTWTLQGTLASRTPQKTRFKRVEGEMLRDVEPWSALAARRRGVSRRHLARMAWRDLLLCQPHDSLCGCSIDPVARAVDARLESAAAQAAGLREDALLDLVGHGRDAARAATAWQPTLLLRNPAARVRSGVAIVELASTLEDEPVGPGSAGKRAAKPAKVRQFVGVPMQPLDIAITRDRTEAPRAYPDNDIVRRTRAAIWVNDVPGFGVVPMPLSARTESRTHTGTPVSVRASSMSNGRITLTWSRSGAVSLSDATAKRTLRNLLTFESRSDVGDLYTPAIRSTRMKARHLRSAVLHRGPLVGVLEQQWRLADSAGQLELVVRLALEAGAPFVRVELLGANAASDHRLRLLIQSDIIGTTSVADAAFGLVDRSVPSVPAAAARMEMPVRTAPLHRYVSRFDAGRGITVFADGPGEYECLKAATAITLLRSVGELSRANLRERPGHAGWPAATPDAQCIGPFNAGVAVMLHGPRSDEVIDEIERTADDVLNPLTGDTLRSATSELARVDGVCLEGAGLAFSTMKESEDGDWLVLRCVNLLDRRSSGVWRVGSPIREARVARLDETAGEVLPVRENAVAFEARALEAHTVLVR